MSAQDRVKWDKRYREEADAPYPPPDPLLLQFTPPVPDSSSRALDLACGRGQNGLWLAAQGYHVDLVDISRVGLEQAQQRLTPDSPYYTNFIQADLQTWDIPPNIYDLICVFRYFNRDLLTELGHALKPQGRLIYQTFNTDYLRQNPTFNPDYVMGMDELSTLFKSWQVVYHQSQTGITKWVGIKHR